MTDEAGAGTTRRGLAVLGFLLAFLVASSLATRAAGMKYVQPLIWPTDIPTFVQLPTDRPIDVAILGSSRASFDLPPNAIDRCLSEKLSRPTRTVNLARAYANSSTLRSVSDDLLVGPRTPKVLLVATEAEGFDEHNPENSAYVAYQAEIEDIPRSIVQADTLGQVFASFLPLVRGTESVAILLAGRAKLEARLRWMMINFGGGQYCYGPEVCVQNNRDVEYSIRDGWANVEKEQLPNLARERFGHYRARTGRGRTNIEALVESAQRRGVKVAFVNVPIHSRWMHAMPSEVYAEYTQTANEIAAKYEVPFLDANTGWRQLDRGDYVDGDHLRPDPARELANEVCADLLTPLLGD